MPSASGDALAVAGHAVDSLTGFGKDELVYPLLTHFAVKTMRVVRVLAGHDGFIEYWLSTDITAVRAVRTYRGAIGQQEQIRVRRYLIITFGAFKAVNVEK